MFVGSPGREGGDLVAAGGAAKGARPPWHHGPASPSPGHRNRALAAAAVIKLLAVQLSDGPLCLQAPKECRKYIYIYTTNIAIATIDLFSK